MERMDEVCAASLRVFAEGCLHGARHGGCLREEAVNPQGIEEVPSFSPVQTTEPNRDALCRTVLEHRYGL